MKLDQPLRIFPTALHPCSYISGLVARNAVVDPSYKMTPEIYDFLLQSGFRRSGEQVYRPYCESCEECVTTRILVNDFKRSRSQKRIWKLNQDLVVKINENMFSKEYLPIYQRYLESRHESVDYEGVEQFLMSKWCNVHFYEFYRHDEEGVEHLIGVAVADQVKSGLSAVYTFFDPDYGSKRSLGVFAVLWQIERAKTLNMDFVYPGFWIKECRKMNYKSNYQPIEGLIKGKWVALEKGTQS